MKSKTIFTISHFLLLLLFILSSYAHSEKQTDWPLMDDSKVQADTPKGKVLGPFPFKSNIYPNTHREYMVYIPDQYNPNTPAASMVIQDGLRLWKSWKLNTVLDNLIHKKKIPITIGIFVDSGKVISQLDTRNTRFNRSFEYDSLGDRFSRFIIEEVYPEIEKTYTLAQTPSSRLIAGSSSGGIAAFNTAWERPDYFGRVLSGVGTYVALRGANELESLVRKHETRPIKVFMQTGEYDNNIYGGHWRYANRELYESLKWAGYETKLVLDKGGHGSKGMMSILPEALEWLWQGYPNAIEKPVANSRQIQLGLHRSNWETLPGFHIKNTTISAFTKVSNAELLISTPDGLYRHNINKQSPRLISKKLSNATAISMGVNDEIYIAKKNKILHFDGQKTKTIIKKVSAHSVLSSSKGLYFSEPSKARIGFYSYTTKELTFYSQINTPSGLSLTTDQGFLHVNSIQGPLSYSFRVASDGRLDAKQEYAYWYRKYAQPSTYGSALKIDMDNRIYNATEYGIQCADQLGRVHIIIAPPLRDKPIEQFELLDGKIIALVNGSLFSRAAKLKGAFSNLQPTLPPRARL